FRSFSPRLYNYIENVTDLIHKHDKTLRREFPGAFAAAEFDLGELGSAPRLQDKDLLHGWRALTALGTYDSRRGGDIILWDDGWVIRFPPGATIFFPAALMRYSFVEVQPGEKQYTFSQYLPAGLARYVANGYESDAQFERLGTKKDLEGLHRMRGRRLDAAINMYSSIDEYISA
ncbi:hypothetical protein C8F04DRAFT_954020, partial [Mycena alexandri]